VDDNGAAHLKAAILGPSESVPIQAGRLLLGTHAPFKYPQVALLCVQSIEAPAADLRAILEENALRLFGH